MKKLLISLIQVLAYFLAIFFVMVLVIIPTHFIFGDQEAMDPRLQILLMTGFPSAEIREEADRARVFRFLEKPVGLDEVARAVADAIREAGL